MIKFYCAVLPLLLGVSDGALRGVDDNALERRNDSRRLSMSMMSMKSGGGGGGGSGDTGDRAGGTWNLEVAPGSCLSAETVYNMYPQVREMAGSLANLEAECGDGGSCFGDSRGCCRFTTGQGMKVGPYVCDADGFEFPAASCICNQHTSLSRADPNYVPEGPVVTVPTEPPAPPMSPEESCQIYTGLNPPENRYAQMYGGGCTASSDCGQGYLDTDLAWRPPCCLSTMCICDRDGLFLPSNTQCLP